MVASSGIDQPRHLNSQDISVILALKSALQIFLDRILEFKEKIFASKLAKSSSLLAVNEIENLELLVSDLHGQSSKELKLFVVAKISWPARTRELACTMVQWSVKYTRSRAKYWTVWDRNLNMNRSLAKFYGSQQKYAFFDISMQPKGHAVWWRCMERSP